ncbi:Methyltransferase domain-containing protein [Abditibacterium utsteinense]|uniref:Methyltransferase domain-containing protein n=1 Tax=Abditibacterium utsteinense TaxID=1960156 RepID=A0A2S8SR82_9BACT|nr:class I SAM-dependent methyltransferase [Abditibacterium utsteinense]PQV63295.1 Methyltransferase domain-containing protein [Abditibacterium utsteinense]
MRNENSNYQPSDAHKYSHRDAHKDATRASRAQFDAHAEKYAASVVHKSGASLAVLQFLAAPVAEDEVLDVATGTGNTAFAVSPHVAHVIGLDVSPKMLDQARKSAERDGFTNVSFLEGAAEHLPFEAARFSLVISRHAPHHFHDVPAFLREVHRVLKPGGRFVLADQITPRADMLEWVDFWQRTRDTSHFSQPTVAQWQAMAQNAGFRCGQERIVPYRLDFLWWTQQSGCDAGAVEALRHHAMSANLAVREAMGLEFDTAGQVQSHQEPIWVARFER